MNNQMVHELDAGNELGSLAHEALAEIHALEQRNEELYQNLKFAVALLTPLFGGTAQVQHMRSVLEKARK